MSYLSKTSYLFSFYWTSLMDWRSRTFPRPVKLYPDLDDLHDFAKLIYDLIGQNLTTEFKILLQVIFYTYSHSVTDLKRSLNVTLT